MREFEKWEMANMKCPICGCRNKIHTQLISPQTNEFVGYTVKCCACGHLTEFFNEHKSNGFSERPDYIPGPQRCIKRMFCPHRDCMLYNTHGQFQPNCVCDCCKRKKKKCLPNDTTVRYQVTESPKFL